MKSTRIELPIPPSVNHLYIGTGKRRRISATYERWQYQANLMIAKQGAPKFRGTQVSVRLEIYGGKGFEQDWDGDNFWKATMDRLVNQGVLEDDSVLFVPKHNDEYFAPTDPDQKARCIVEITEIEGE
jgi:Holliday junction resolvase RusA-like endonuclease